MDASAERERVDVGPGEVERVGRLVPARVAVGRAEHQEHRVAGRDRDASDLDVLGGDPVRELERGVVAEQLRCEVGGQIGLRAQQFVLIGLVEEAHDRVADEVRRRLEAGDEQQQQHVVEFAVVEGVVGVVGHQRTQQVVGRLGPPSSDEVTEVAGAELVRLVGSIELLLRRGDLEALGEREDRISEAGQVVGGDTEQLSDHGHREPERDAVHEVATTRGLELVEQAGDELVDPWSQLLDTTRREGPRDPRAQP